MVGEAERHAGEDKKRRRLVEAKNNADAMVYQTEKGLKEYGDKVSDTDRRAVEDALETLRQAAKGDDADAIEAALSGLTSVSHKMAEAMYAQAGQQAPPQPEPGAAAGDAMDADFTVKDGDDKNN